MSLSLDGHNIANGYVPRNERERKETLALFSILRDCLDHMIEFQATVPLSGGTRLCEQLEEFKE